MAGSGNQTIKRYLLGTLDNSHRDQLEEQLLSDEELFEELLISEDELVDQYLAGRLTDLEKSQFESHFLVTPERYRKFEFGRTLTKYLEINDVPETGRAVRFSVRELLMRLKLWPVRQPVLAFSIITVACLVSLGLYWTAFRTNDARVTPPYVISLVAGATRSQGGNFVRVAVPSEATHVELRLAVATRYDNYSAELWSDTGKVAHIQSFRTVEEKGNKTAVFLIPANQLPANDYQLKLTGTTASGEHEPIDTYYFGIRDR